MCKRFVCIWFRYLKTDWLTRRRPALQHVPFALVSPDRGRMIVTAVNPLAEQQGIIAGMVLADARAIISSLQTFDDDPQLHNKILNAIAGWCIRFSPVVSIDGLDGLIIDASGCAHLWGNEEKYITDMGMRLKEFGYSIRVAMADTIGSAWAFSRFGNEPLLIEKGHQITAILTLPPAALRLETEIVERLHKLGLCQVKSFVNMQRSALRRRFGQQLLQRLDQALGNEEERIIPVQPIVLYQERLPCLEPIVTATGIEIGLQRLLAMLCNRLQENGKGLRLAVFKCYRVDGKVEQIEISTGRASNHADHLFDLFEDKLSSIEPALGIELFVLEAPKVENVSAIQEKMWESICGLDNVKLSELIDRLSNKIGMNNIHRYEPDEHYWPERSIKPASSLHAAISTSWRENKPRPVHLLTPPEPIEVTAPIPDYPPMLFRYKGNLHKIKKADGPERIEREWWLDEGQHRDYYLVEDEEGHRYWLFRSGHYTEENTQKWFIHGFFA